MPSDITDEARRLYEVVAEKCPEIIEGFDIHVSFPTDADILAAAFRCAMKLLDMGYVFKRERDALWVRLEYNSGTCQRSVCCGNDIETVFSALIAEKVADGTISEDAVLAEKGIEHE